MADAIPVGPRPSIQAVKSMKAKSHSKQDKPALPYERTHARKGLKVIRHKEHGQ